MIYRKVNPTIRSALRMGCGEQLSLSSGLLQLAQAPAGSAKKNATWRERRRRSGE